LTARDQEKPSCLNGNNTAHAHTSERFILNSDGCKAPDKRCTYNIAGELQQSQKNKKLQPNPNKLQRGPWYKKANMIQSNVRLHLQIDAGSDDGLQLRRWGHTI
jgi:hypothetical protein